MARSLAALGFAPHSGWAAVIAVGGSAARPEILLRSRIELTERRDPASRQPYHAVEGLAVEQAARRLEAYAATAEALAHAAIRGCLDELAGRGHGVKAAGILDSSGRKGSSLAAILASHALIHTADGEHFRQALAAGSARCGVAVASVPLRELEQEAARALGRPAGRLAAAVKELGRPLGPPWGADQKSAALLAWLLLAS